MTRSSATVLLASLLLGMLLTGCGFSTRHTLGPERLSLGIKIFANEGREPDLERHLHRQLTLAARHLVDAPLVAPSHADLTLSGRILEYHTRGGVRDKDNTLLERGVNLTIEASLHDSSGLLLAGPVILSQDVGHTTREAGGARAAEDRAVANLAEGVILDLLIDLEQRRRESQTAAPKTP